MKFLLVNENVAVRKLFNISAKKADIKLDIVDSVANIPMQEDYGYIFVDDGVVDVDSVRNIRNKMITTKFCLILSKNADAGGRFSNFDKYIRKPFLPVDIYEVLKKEKYNDMNLNTSYESVSADNVDISVSNDDISLDNNLLQATDVSDIDMSNINSPINDIDLSDFNDNQDEFITGTMNELDSIPVENNSYGFMDDIGIMPSDMQINDNLQEVGINNADSNIANENIVVDNNSFGSNDNIRSNRDDNEIDFSSVFALQDEILRTQDQEKKPLIGGDISVRKDSTINNAVANEDNMNNDVVDNSIVNNTIDMGDALNEDMSDDFDINLSPQQYIQHDTVDVEPSINNIDIDNIDINNNMSETFVQNSLDINLNDDVNHDLSNNIYDIETMSEQELEALDDEELIRLQESSHTNANDTMILDKNTIDEVNNILDQTENYNESVKIASQDFNSLTEEALSEVLEEDSTGAMYNKDNSLINNIDFNNEKLQSDSKTNNPPPNINMNGVSDIAEIIKAFPVDKLRELLSGAQITINITFPSKNN